MLQPGSKTRSSPKEATPGDSGRGRCYGLLPSLPLRALPNVLAFNCLWLPNGSPKNKWSICHRCVWWHRALWNIHVYMYIYIHHWAPAEMFMLLFISELTYTGSLKKISEDKMLFYGTFWGVKKYFCHLWSFHRQQLILLEYYYHGDEWTQRIFYPAVQLFPQFSLHTWHHQAGGRDTSLLTCPCVSTMIRSQPRTVCRRWAIVNIVQSANASLMVSWISKSVSVSIAAVASSRIRIWKQHRILAVSHGHTFPPWIQKYTEQAEWPQPSVVTTGNPYSYGHKHRFYKYPSSFLYVIAFSKAYGWHILQSHPRTWHRLWPEPQVSTNFNFIFNRWISNTNFTSKLIWHITAGDIPPGMSQYWLGWIAFLHWVRSLFPSNKLIWSDFLSELIWACFVQVLHRQQQLLLSSLTLKADAQWTLKYEMFVAFQKKGC